MVDLREHPDIEWATRTGYPSYAQPKYVHCCECGDELAYDEVYEDEKYFTLCEYCLKRLHRKVW